MVSVDEDRDIKHVHDVLVDGLKKKHWTLLVFIHSLVGISSSGYSPQKMTLLCVQDVLQKGSQ